MKILVTGAAGRLGSQLVRLLSAAGHSVTGADIIGDNVQHVDLSDFAATRTLVEQVAPEIVIHPAAWTDVDGCAREPEKAVRINGFGTQHVALAAARVGAAIAYISSNEVFDGQAGRAYQEYDATRPINPYGYSKWVGEQALLHINPRHYIIRTAWLFAHGGKNFIQAILNAAAAGKRLRVVTDEVANPTYNDDLALAISQLIQTERYGVYHLVNAGWCSRYEFAQYFLAQTQYAGTPVEPITSADWPRASAPPLFCPLENLAGAHMGVTLRPWQAAVDAFLLKEGLAR